MTLDNPSYLIQGQLFLQKLNFQSETLRALSMEGFKLLAGEDIQAPQQMRHGIILEERHKNKRGDQTTL